MACNTVVSSLTAAPAVGLSSSASLFAGATSCPSMMTSLSPACSAKPFAVTCSAASDKESASRPRNAALTSLVAAGAALAVFAAGNVAPVDAAIGPGGSGAERTAQKAQELLESADKKNIEEAPQRFGPGRIGESVKEASKLAQDAGGKALSQIKGGVSELGSLSLGTGDVEDAARKVQGNIDQATGSGGGGLFGAIRGSIENIKESVESKDADAKRTLDEATNKAQSTVQDTIQ